MPTYPAGVQQTGGVRRDPFSVAAMRNLPQTNPYNPLSNPPTSDFPGGSQVRWPYPAGQNPFSSGSVRVPATPGEGYGSTPWLQNTGDVGLRQPEYGPQNDTQRFLANIGPAAELFPYGDIERGDLGAIQFGANYGLFQQGLRDRETAFNQLQQGRSAIGSAPSAIVARELAVERARGPGPGGAIRGQGAVLSDDISRQLAESYAARGIGGAVPMIADMRAQRDLGADIAERAALADQQAGLQNLQQLAQISQYEDAQRAAFDQAMANLFSSTEYAPFDFSAIVTRPDERRRLVGE